MLADIQWWIWTWYQCHHNYTGGVQCRLHHMVITIHMEEYSAGYITWWLQCTWWSTVQATSHGDYNAHGGVQCRIHHMVITMHMVEYNAGYIRWWLQCTCMRNACVNAQTYNTPLPHRYSGRLQFGPPWERFYLHHGCSKRKQDTTRSVNKHI